LGLRDPETREGEERKNQSPRFYSLIGDPAEGEREEKKADRGVPCSSGLPKEKRGKGKKDREGDGGAILSILFRGALRREVNERKRGGEDLTVYTVSAVPSLRTGKKGEESCLTLPSASAQGKEKDKSNLHRYFH